MEELSKLIDEYNIRFKDTEIIRKEGYPFDSECELGRDDCAVKIIPTEIWNQYGCVYKQGVWATAGIKILPERWVVELNKSNPSSNKFISWYKNNKIDLPDSFFEHDIFFSNTGGGNDLLNFQDHQFLTLEQWAEFYLPKIDLSIIEKNKGKWLYVRRGYPWILKDVYVYEDEIKKYDSAVSYSTHTNIVFENKGTWGYIKDITELRLATEEDLNPFFEKYPEYAPPANKASEPQPGDFGLICDNVKWMIESIKSGNIIINKLSRIDVTEFPYIYVVDNSKWKYFYPIDIDLPLRPQLDEFVRQNQKMTEK